jgi:mannose-1-phosphate guanylyltransferase
MWGIVFAGGIGSRFWPLSSPARPKQLLPLVDDRPLIADTVRRLRELIPPERVLVMTSADIAPAIHAAIPEVPAANMLAEATPMGTAASLAWGVAEVRKRAGASALLCATHADLAISFMELFHDALRRAATTAGASDTMVLLGVRPTRADTAFGYITARPNEGGGRVSIEAFGSAGFASAMEVTAFTEKPTVIEAQALVRGGALWHSGIFVSRVRTVERELRERTPEVAAVLDAQSPEQVARHFSGVRSASIEKGLFERSSALKVLAVDFGWDVVGTWHSLRRARDLDDAGNGTVGTAHLVESSAIIVHNEQGVTVLYGINDLLVVRLGDITFITTLEKARDLRGLLEILPPDVGRRVQE